MEIPWHTHPAPDDGADLRIDMGLLDSVFGTDDGTTGSQDRTETKYAIMINAGPDRAPTANNAFEYAVDLDDEGYEVEVFLDGQATKWPAEFADNPDRPFTHRWKQIQRRGVLAGACGYCANAFGAKEACELADVQLLSGDEQHAPSVGKLARENYEIITMG